MFDYHDLFLYLDYFKSDITLQEYQYYKKELYKVFYYCIYTNNILFENCNIIIRKIMEKLISNAYDIDYRLYYSDKNLLQYIIRFMKHVGIECFLKDESKIEKCINIIKENFNKEIEIFTAETLLELSNIIRAREEVHTVSLTNCST